MDQSAFLGSSCLIAIFAGISLLKRGYGIRTELASIVQLVKSVLLLGSSIDRGELFRSEVEGVLASLRSFQ